MKFNKNQLIYVVDDDKPLNMMIVKFLNSKGFTRIESFYTGEEALEACNAGENPIFIQDFDLPGINGLDVLKNIKKKFPKSEFVFLSGQSSIEVAVEAIKFGAFDYIIKDNFAKENVHTKICNLLKIKALYSSHKTLKYTLFVISILLLLTWFSVFMFYYSKS